jgi:hypothetical protein
MKNRIISVCLKNEKHSRQDSAKNVDFSIGIKIALYMGEMKKAENTQGGNNYGYERCF